MSSASHSSVAGNMSNHSRPQPASPPLQQAPPPPPPQSSIHHRSSRSSIPRRASLPPRRAVSMPPLRPHGHHMSPPPPFPRQPHPGYTQTMPSQHTHRNYIRSPSNFSTMATPTPFDDELLSQLTQDELIARFKSLEAKNRKLLHYNGTIMKDINMTFSQLQQMKHHNFQLMGDNNELRDLCCYLDDERSKTRSLAREWQSFGNHMSQVMRQEITQYSGKLTQLESKQFELVRENFELKQLCLLLDNARLMRENGDGSTGSMASNSEENSIQDDQNNNMASLAAHRHHHRVLISQQILEYIRHLEHRNQQLEWERKRQPQPPPRPKSQPNLDRRPSFTDNAANADAGGVVCPPAVAEAMRVLRIHDSLSDEATLGRKSNAGRQRTREEESSLEQQRSVVRKLCNVAWRKIEEGSWN